MRCVIADHRLTLDLQLDGEFNDFTTLNSMSYADENVGRIGDLIACLYCRLRHASPSTFSKNCPV